MASTKSGTNDYVGVPATDKRLKPLVIRKRRLPADDAQSTVEKIAGDVREVLHSKSLSDNIQGSCNKTFRSSSNSATSKPLQLTIVELFCAETLSPLRAADDRKRVEGGNNRVINGLLECECHFQLSMNPYDGETQPEISETMRSDLIHWIFEICDSNRCNDGVFSLTIHLIDRLLSITKLRRQVRAKNYQLIGGVCLFIASKFVDCSDESCMSAEQIVRYSDNSFTRTQLLESELAVLQAFSWEVFAITPIDFVDHILCHLSLGDSSVIIRARYHTVTFIALCAHNVHFSIDHPPSTIATACIRLAVSIILGEDWCRLNSIDQRLYQITHTEPDYVTACCNQIESFMSVCYAAGRLDRKLMPTFTNANSIDPKCRDTRVTPETPSDIRDISPDGDHPLCGKLVDDSFNA